MSDSEGRPKVEAATFARLCEIVRSAREFAWKSDEPYTGPIDPVAVIRGLDPGRDGASAWKLRLVVADHVPKRLLSDREGLRPGRVFHVVMARLGDDFTLPDFDQEQGRLGGLTSICFEHATAQKLCAERPTYEMVYPR